MSYIFRSIKYNCLREIYYDTYDLSITFYENKNSLLFRYERKT